MQTIAVFALKGGVGKSALTIFLADFLSSIYDQRVLVVDLDPQQSATIALLGEDQLLAALRRDASFGRLMLDTIERKPRAANVLSYTTVRPMVKEKGRYKYLQAVSVMASDREAWHDLNDRLSAIPAAQQPAVWKILAGALRPARDEFDICLLDFPAAYTGAVTKNGIFAADWWLLPIEPNRMAARDIDGPRHVLRQVYRLSNKKLKGLGTVLSRCQNRQSSEYIRTRAVLKRLEQQRLVPKLFSKDAEVSLSVDALNALDDTLRDSYRTIDQKYGGPAKPLHEDVRKLTREILERLKIQVKEPSELDTDADANEEVTRTYQTV